MGPRACLYAALAAVLVTSTASPAICQIGPGAKQPSPAGAGARSLVVPGWGQWAQGQRRATAYAALEAVLWALWADRRTRAFELREEYRDLAWVSARIPAGARRDGTWAYYEVLSKWKRSGAWDRDPSSLGVQPEEDPTTFNGSIWSLAVAIHFGGRSPSPDDAAWGAALAWYQKRAYGDGFLWDWTGREREMASFGRLIRDSDNRFREATAALGAVLTNHLLSATDAFVSARVPGSAELRVLAPASPGWPPLQVMLSWRPLG